jgi:hypothetical protein
VYEPDPGSQINDFNPGIEPSGLFWTIAVPDAAVDVNFGAGRARLAVGNVPVLDFGDIINALFGPRPPVPATVSFDVRWSGIGERTSLVNHTQGFTGEFIRNTAQMEWTARVGDFAFVSGPASTSTSVFAEIGHERNGTFSHSTSERGKKQNVKGHTEARMTAPQTSL